MAELFQDNPDEGQLEGANTPPTAPATASDYSLPTPVQPHHRDEEQHKQLFRWIEAADITSDLDDSLLGEIGQRVSREYDIDHNSRNDWLAKSKKAMDLAMQVAETKQYPWPRACLSLDTDILTVDGWKPIAEVRKGELVYTRDNKGVADYAPVSETFRYVSETIVSLRSKNIDLLVTPNHNMLVETKHRHTRFMKAEEFLADHLPLAYIPLKSKWTIGGSPDTLHGVDAKAYLRLLGWYIAEGSAVKTHSGPSSFIIAQSKSANPKKYQQIKDDIEACGFTWRECKNADRGIIVHASTMPQSMKDELRGLGIHYTKRLPNFVLFLAPDYIKELLSTMVAGDGHSRMRAHHKQTSTVYHTTSHDLASQVQDLCQKIGMQAKIYATPAKVGGFIRGRQIKGVHPCYCVSFNRSERTKISALKRELLPYNREVACVEVEPHHTIYVRRNGIPVWVGNSNVIYPLMTTAAIQFAARAYPAIIQNRNVVKGVVVGEDQGVPAVNPQTGVPPLINPQTGQPMWIVPPGAKRDRAGKIGEHMSWQLLDEQSEWEEETDRLMHILPISGCAFRKSFFNSGLGRNMSLLVTASKLVVNYFAKSLETAPRITEEVMMYPLEITEMERAGLFREINYSASVVDANDEDAPQEFLEQHRWWDLDEDGFPEPYVITVHKASSQVVRIVARYDYDSIKFNATDGRVMKIDPIHYYTKYDFLPNPEGGIYGVGFGQLLRPINEAVNTSLNMLIDSGHLAVTGGGFIGKGLSMHTGTVRFVPGEYKAVNATGAAVKDNIVPLSFPGPSSVLFQLLGTLIEAGKEISAVKDVLTGEQKNSNVPATTTLALIEQGLKTFTAIYKRIHRSLKAELDKLYRLNSIYLPEAGAGYRLNNEWKSISKQDYQKGSGVEPVSDPTMVSDMQKLGRAQFLMTFANDPWFDARKIRERVLDAAMIEKADELLVQSLPPNPEMLEKATKLQQAEHRVKAEALKDAAQAVLFITQADALMGDQHLEWAKHQLEAIKTEIEALQGNGGPSNSAPAGGAGNGGGLQGVAAPSGNQGPVQLPSGLSTSPPQGGAGPPAGG